MRGPSNFSKDIEMILAFIVNFDDSDDGITTVGSTDSTIERCLQEREIFIIDTRECEMRDDTRTEYWNRVSSRKVPGPLSENARLSCTYANPLGLGG